MFATRGELDAERRATEHIRLALQEADRRADALAQELAELRGPAYVVLPRLTLEAMALELTTLKAQKSQLEVRVATAQANFDWLAAQMNELRVERAALFERAFQMKVPMPVIGYEPLHGADMQYAPSAEGRPPANIGDVMQMARDFAEAAQKQRTDVESIGGEGVIGLFDDVGDQAGKLGLRHDEAAEVIT